VVIRSWLAFLAIAVAAARESEVSSGGERDKTDDKPFGMSNRTIWQYYRHKLRLNQLSLVNNHTLVNYTVYPSWLEIDFHR
jgi:hypothetical protein